MDQVLSRQIRKVACSVCSKVFLKPLHHINQNLKLGHNFYCSYECMSNSRKTGRRLICENQNCNKKFYRVKHAILKHNFCSQSCAAIVNNQRHPKWPKRYCTICKKEFKNRDSRYCSSKCGWSAFRAHRLSQYTPKIIQKTIKQLSKNLGRSPSRRELGNMSHGAIRSFGSWNKAVIAAGFEPHRSDDNRMYRRTRTKAWDGHICDSISEAIIDNWLAKHNIFHIRDAKYPTTNHKADWSVKNGKTFVEYFGLAQDSPRYDRAVKEKIKLCRKNKIKLIGIYSKDLYPNNQLGKILSRLI